MLLSVEGSETDLSQFGSLERRLGQHSLPNMELNRDVGYCYVNQGMNV